MIILDGGRGWVQISVLVSPDISLLKNSLYLPIWCIDLERRLTFCLHATPPIELSRDSNVRCFIQTFHRRMFFRKMSVIDCFLMSDSVPSKIVGCWWRHNKNIENCWISLNQSKCLDPWKLIQNGGKVLSLHVWFSKIYLERLLIFSFRFRGLDFRQYYQFST